MLRKTSAAAAVIAFATVGSALFGGAALANGGHDDKADPPTFAGGAGGEGGDAKTVCFIVGDQSWSGKNVVGDPKPLAGFTCTSTGGAGGAGGTASAEY